MDALLIAANWLLPLFYMGLLIDYGGAFFLRTKTHVRSRWLPVVVALHLLFLLARGLLLGRPPMVGAYEILSILAVATAFVYWVLELAGGDRRTGVFVLLLVFLFQYTSSTFLEHTVAAEVQSDWLRLHVVPVLLAYTALALAAVYGLLYLVAQRSLKLRRFGLFFDRLPPLELLGRMTWYALLIGLLFVTVSIVTGAILARKISAVAESLIWNPKVVSKMVIGPIAWLICVTAVLGRLLGKWSASRVCAIAVSGFLVIMALLVASMLLS